jgi:hypothetical protein
MRAGIIREIRRPRCPCGGATRLGRIARHPVHGPGYEIRYFECERCGHERTTETAPDEALLVPDTPPAGRRSLWALLMGR